MTGPGLPIWDALPPGVVHLKHYSQGYDQVKCGHDPSSITVTVSGMRLCRVCKADEFRTSEFRCAVLMLVKLARGALDRQTQEVLF